MTQNLPERPEPLLPEHQLIRSAAVLPVLSPDLRQRVVSDCRQQIWFARWKFRLSCGLSVLALCGGAFLAIRALSHSTAVAPEPPPASESTVPADSSPGYSSSAVGAGTSIINEEATPPSPP